MSTPIVSAIVVMAENRIIGSNNHLPWRLPADLKHFKTLTTGHPVVMGRKTFESIGKPLPNRFNIIISRNQAFHAPNCVVVQSINDAIQHAAALNSNEIFVIGGADIYKQALPHIKRIYLTIIHHTFDGDTYFPELNMSHWEEYEHITHPADKENIYSYSFVTLERKDYFTHNPP